MQASLHETVEFSALIFDIRDMFFQQGIEKLIILHDEIVKKCFATAKLVDKKSKWPDICGKGVV